MVEATLKYIYFRNVKCFDVYSLIIYLSLSETCLLCSVQRLVKKDAKFGRRHGKEKI